jgi:hypothetical protein
MILKKGLRGRDKADALARALSRMHEERSEFHFQWEEAQTFCSSVLFKFNSDGRDESDRRYETPRRISGRPANYLQTLVTGICGYSINPNIAWLKLGLEDESLMEEYGVKDWLEKVEGLLYKEFNRSNLYAQVPLMIAASATVGHGVMLIDEDIDAFRIRTAAMNTPEIYLDTDEYDEPDTVFRKFYMTHESAAAFFGLDSLAQEVRDGWDEEKAAVKKIAVLHAVYRNKDADGANAAGGFPYASVFVDLDNRHIIKEGGYADMPYAVFVWEKILGKKYGISPAMAAVNDIEFYFCAEESRLTLAELSAKGVYNVPEGIKGKEQLLPGGRNYYSASEGKIEPVAIGQNYPITIEITHDLEERVKDWFHVDFFLMLQQMSRQMTATEVIELQGEKAAVLSNLVANLNSALQKIVQRSVDILFRQGKIPELPFALQRRRTAMKVDFSGILAQAQKKAHETSGIMQGMQVMGALAQLAPAVPQIAEAFDYVDAAQILKRGFEAGGMSQLAIREEDDVAAMRQQRAAAQAQAAEAQIALQQQESAMRNFKALNEPVNPEGAFARMAGAS